MLAYAENHHLLPKLTNLAVRGPFGNVASGQFDWLRLLVPPTLAQLSFSLPGATPHRASELDSTIEFTGKIIKKCPHLSTLCLFGNHENTMIKTPRSRVFDRLALPLELHTLYLNYEFINDGLLDWMAEIPSLKVLRLGHLRDEHTRMIEKASFPSGSFSALKSLELQFTMEVEPFVALWNTCLVRQHISLSLSFSLGQQEYFRLFVPVIAANSPHIITLSFEGGTPEDLEDVTDVLNALSPLKLNCLTLDFPMAPNCDLVPCIASNWPSLTELALPRVNLGLADLFNLIVECPTLTSLTFCAMCDIGCDDLPDISESSMMRLDLHCVVNAIYSPDLDFLARYVLITCGMHQPYVFTHVGFLSRCGQTLSVIE